MNCLIAILLCVDCTNYFRMNYQSLNLKNSSVLSEEELMMLLGGGFDQNDTIAKPGDNTSKCNKCDRCDKCICL